MKTQERYHPSLLVASLVIATVCFIIERLLIWGITVLVLSAFAFFTCPSTDQEDK